MANRGDNPYEAGEPVAEGPGGGIAIWIAFGLLGFAALGFFAYSTVRRNRMAEELEAMRLQTEYEQRMVEMEKAAADKPKVTEP